MRLHLFFIYDAISSYYEETNQTGKLDPFETAKLVMYF